MCSRFLLLRQHYDDLLNRLGIARRVDTVSRFEIAPGTAIAVVRQTAPATGVLSSALPVRTAELLRWGFVPAWAKAVESRPLINAHAETVALKPTFRDAFRTRRCVIPASGYYEWQTAGRTKKPWLVQRRDQQPFAFAGVWESWRGLDAPPLETCALLTTEPNETTREIHDRMPVMLTVEQCETWLTPEADAAALTPLLQSSPAQDLSAVAGTTRTELLATSSSTALEDVFAGWIPGSTRPAASPGADPFMPWFS